MNIIKPFALVLLTFLSVTNTHTLNAKENYGHFPSLPSPDLKTALCNLASYNEKLKTIHSQNEMSIEDMVKIHELTYTLENAIQRLQRELVTISDDLEKVHKASEKMDFEVIKDSGDAYLNSTTYITDSVPCA